MIESRRGLPETLRILSREILIGSSSGTYISRSSATPCDVVLEPAVALTVASRMKRAAVVHGRRGRAPELAGLLVSQIDRFARAIGDRIVRPRRELVLATVHRPRVAAALRGDLEPESRIRNHVDPRRRCRLPRPEQRDVLAAVGGEAAQPVEVLEIRRQRVPRARCLREWSCAAARVPCPPQAALRRRSS